MIVDKVHQKFGTIVAELDESNNGKLSWEEFQQIWNYPEALAALESVGVDADIMVDMAEDFFFDDGEPLEVSFEEFMDMVLDLRGGQTATIKDVMRLGKRYSAKFLKVKGCMDGIEEKVA